MVRLKQRADFLAAASGAKVATAAFVLQGRNRDDGGPARIGFTVSRKVGTAVERNRVRRRLRDIVRRSAADSLRSGYDYVLVGRRTALSRQFDHMIEDFRNALRRLERQRATPPPVPRPPAGDGRTGTRASDPPGAGRKTGR
jgi:ribonuclease P protein component